MTGLKRKFSNFLQSLIATMGVSQILSACGGSGNSSSENTDASFPLEYDLSRVAVELVGSSYSESLVGNGNDATGVIGRAGDDLIQTFA